MRDAIEYQSVYVKESWMIFPLTQRSTRPRVDLERSLDERRDASRYTDRAFRSARDRLEDDLNSRRSIDRYTASYFAENISRDTRDIQVL